MGRGTCGAGRRSCLHYRGLVAGEPEAWRASKSKDLEKRGTCGAGLEKRGGRTCGAWKSKGLEKQLDCEPGKAEVRGRGADNNWRHDEGWRLSTRDWRQGGEARAAGAGDSGQREEQQETAAAQWQRSLIFSSQSKNCGVRSGGGLLAGLNYALVDSLEFGGATHKSV